MATPVDPSEVLTRFVIYNRWFKKSGRFNAFMPYMDETSVFRTTSISVDDIWDIGDREVAPQRGKPILGRADIGALNVKSNDLQVTPNEPPVNHAVITGWPDEESKQKEIALELASTADFFER